MLNTVWEDRQGGQVRVLARPMLKHTDKWMITYESLESLHVWVESEETFKARFRKVS